jgi:hypothetical protein
MWNGLIIVLEMARVRKCVAREQTPFWSWITGGGLNLTSIHLLYIDFWVRPSLFLSAVLNCLSYFGLGTNVSRVWVFSRLFPKKNHFHHTPDLVQISIAWWFELEWLLVRTILGNFFEFCDDRFGWFRIFTNIDRSCNKFGTNSCG